MSACPISFDQLSSAAQRATAPSAPPAARMMAARGLAPMPPRDLITAQYVLTFDKDPKISAQAEESLGMMDQRLANAVLSDPALNPHVLGALAESLVARDADVERILLNNSTPDRAFFMAATRGSEAICEVIANNQARVLKTPEIARALHGNVQALKSTTERVIDFLVRNGVVLEDMPEFETALLRLSGKERKSAAESIELNVPASMLEPEFLSDEQRELRDDESLLSDDEELSDEEDTDDRKLSIDQLVKDMTTGEKVALATKGNKSARSILIRDRNRVVAMAAISAPSITEPEAVNAAKSRTVHQDVIGFISRNKDWMKNYQIKAALVGNPKTPLPTAMKLVPTLQKRELRNISKSKNVPLGVRTLAGRLVKQRM
jgi:hypothetical protein